MVKVYADAGPEYAGCQEKKRPVAIDDGPLWGIGCCGLAPSPHPCPVATSTMCTRMIFPMVAKGKTQA